MADFVSSNMDVSTITFNIVHILFNFVQLQWLLGTFFRRKDSPGQLSRIVANVVDWIWTNNLVPAFYAPHSMRKIYPHLMMSFKSKRNAQFQWVWRIEMNRGSKKLYHIDCEYNRRIECIQTNKKDSNLKNLFRLLHHHQILFACRLRICILYWQEEKWANVWQTPNVTQNVWRYEPVILCVQSSKPTFLCEGTRPSKNEIILCIDIFFIK